MLLKDLRCFSQVNNNRRRLICVVYMPLSPAQFKPKLTLSVVLNNESQSPRPVRCYSETYRDAEPRALAVTAAPGLSQSRLIDETVSLQRLCPFGDTKRLPDSLLL